MYKYLSLCREREKFRARLIDAMKQRGKREKGEGEEAKDDDVIVENNDDILRYYYYLTRGIDDTYVGAMDVDLLKNIVKRVPTKWKEKFKESLNRLVEEAKEGYVLNVKMSVVEFVIGDSMYCSLKEADRQIVAPSQAGVLLSFSQQHSVAQVWITLVQAR
ncbi:unnamed protein product [Heterotrigona itama]|uniref:Uncharacterized protein n=1 Tax=Heterotrigona itama TaxID=395501 RepID=A0A6V7H890_9HYME|nr:unnamed protein product [Heterotrigona itama]